MKVENIKFGLGCVGLVVSVVLWATCAKSEDMPTWSELSYKAEKLRDGACNTASKARDDYQELFLRYVFQDKEVSERQVLDSAEQYRKLSGWCEYAKARFEVVRQLAKTENTSPR